ncbi:MAG: type I restriction enzyme HsdR N-terminal domain-containing protein [Fimbriimonadales bacterium]|nr:type I restriction enzyme HsdR N-terminal domain-containing protein [Fimbriimonadales bacterium]
MSLEARRRELCAKLERWRTWGALNEEATIQGLILPVLQAAGYDIHDLEQVYPQPRDSQGKYPDLMLYKNSPMDGGAEWCVIEAKKLGETLDKFVSQIGQYLTGSQARWYALTDGAEWRFYDKHKGQHNFHCITLTLEMPGALDALRCLLQPALSEPDLEGAHRTLIEAQLHEVARKTSWRDHCTGWRLTRALVYSLRTAVEQLMKQYPEHMHCVQQWAMDFEKHLEQGEPPPWWGEAEEGTEGGGEIASIPPPKSLPTTEGEGEPIARVYRRGIELRGYSPYRIVIRGQSYSVSDWVQALITLIRVLDDSGCLPEPPCPPGRSWGVYDKHPHKWIKPRMYQSKQHGLLYVNKHGNAPQLAERLYSIAYHSKCPDVTPETVLICLRKRE